MVLIFIKYVVYDVDMVYCFLVKILIVFAILLKF
jgi:hypothetical protein